MCVRVYTYRYTYVCMYVCMFAGMYVCMYVCTYVHMYAGVSLNMRMREHSESTGEKGVRRRGRPSGSMHAHKNTYIHTSKQQHMFTHRGHNRTHLSVTCRCKETQLALHVAQGIAAQHPSCT